MNRYYLLSNGPERACVSCYDPDLPAGQRVRPLLREGLPLADQQELYTREFHDRLLAALPAEYRQEPEHWLVACSRDLFIGFSQEALTESLMSAGYSRPRPVADTDAVMAFYEDRFSAVSRLNKDAGLLVFTAGEEEFRAETFVPDAFEENFLPARYTKGEDASAAGRFLKEVLDRQDGRPKQRRQGGDPMSQTLTVPQKISRWLAELSATGIAIVVPRCERQSDLHALVPLIHSRKGWRAAYTR